MFKKYLTYPLLLALFLFLIFSILYGSVLRHHYMGGERVKTLQNIAVFFAEIPMNVKTMIQSGNINLDALPKLEKHKDKKRIEQFISNQRDALLVLPRYDHSLSRSVVDIIDLINFKTIHTYKHDIAEMNNQVVNIDEFPRIKTDHSPIRFQYFHPLILEDGSLVSDSDMSIEFKIDFCSNLLWINDEELFHHSKMLDHEGNIWVPGVMNPKSKYLKDDYYYLKNYADDSIIKINTDGDILFNKSITELLIENNIIDKNIFHSGDDPIHSNDIEPALSTSNYWKKGDIFISARHLSAIIHYRPSTNTVINYIKGPFSQQHDVDIISDKAISIFNNNNFFFENDHSEVVVYNFETKEFSVLFKKQLQKENFKTESQGLSHIFNDGALLVEEQNHGRLLLFNNKGEKEWEFVNKDKNGDIGYISWSRIVEDKEFISQFRKLVKTKKCIN